MIDSLKNFAFADVIKGHSADTNTVEVVAGNGSHLPPPPFNATWYCKTLYGDPARDPNVEIIRVTDIHEDTLTVLRGQEGTIPSSKDRPLMEYEIFVGITKKTIEDLVFHLEDFSTQKISNIVGSAPETLDTLQEISKALQDNADFGTFITDEIGKKADKLWVQNNFNKYIHPNDGGQSRDNMKGAEILSSIIVNSLGHVTSTNVRYLTPQDIGASPAHAHPYLPLSWKPTWTDIQDKPSTATRFPRFDEITNKPETYPSSKHSINYHTDIEAEAPSNKHVLSYKDGKYKSMTLLEAGIQYAGDYVMQSGYNKQNWDNAYIHSISPHDYEPANVNIQGHISDSGLHFQMDDYNSSVNKVWSSDKIQRELNDKQQAGHYLSENDLITLSGDIDGVGRTDIEVTLKNKNNYENAYLHSVSSHAPSDAQKNSLITKEEIEAKLTGLITTHKHPEAYEGSGGAGAEIIYGLLGS